MTTKPPVLGNIVRSRLAALAAGAVALVYASVTRVGVSLAVLATVAGVGAGENQGRGPGDQSTKQAQVELVAGMEPARVKSRFLRDLNEPRPARPAKPGAAADPEELRAGESELAKVRENISGSDWPAEPEPGKERAIFAFGGKETELEFDVSELAKLADAAVRRRVSDATEGSMGRAEPAHDYPMVPAGWSNGIDSRVVKPVNATYPINHRVLMRIGELNGEGCSGALVGRRLVLTAAHCIVRADLSYNVHAYRARRSGSQMPFGTANSIGYWYASKWVSNNCHQNRTWECSPHDWAVLLLPDNAWANSPNGTPGWMGYWVYSQNYISQNAVSHNDGYPASWWSNKPANHQMNQPYGQLAGCTATGFEWPFDGVASYYRTSCDMSGGHSGSPNWTDYPGAKGPYVIGIAMWSHCFECTNAEGTWKSHPSGFRGMTHYLAGFITDQRIAYP